MFGDGGERQVEPRGCDRYRSRHPRLCGGLAMSLTTPPAPFPVVRPCDLRASAASSTPWLIDQLWTAQAVGIIGGSPKSYKTWFALEMAVAVASGSPGLQTFAVSSPGPVLLYAAEDSESALRLRLESLAQHHRLQLAFLDIRVITADSLRLDRAADQDRLEATLMLHRPALLILDPLVRLHAIDENAAGEIAALLGYLRRVWLSYWTLTPQAVRTALRNGRSVKAIAGSHRSLSARARSCTMCCPVSCFQRAPQRFIRISNRLLQVASTLPLPSAKPSRRARA